MGNSKKFPISQKAHSLYEKIIFCHRPLLYLQTKKIPRTSQSMVIATQTPKIPIWNTMVLSIISMWVFRFGFSYLLTMVFHMEMMESTMVTFTSAAARSVFGSVKDSGQIVTTQAA